jgi:hypothetical protein
MEPMQDFILQNFAVEHKDDGRRRMAALAAATGDGSESEPDSLASRVEDSDEDPEKSGDDDDDGDDDSDSDSDSDSDDEGGTPSLTRSQSKAKAEPDCDVVLSNLPYAADEEDLRDFCEDYGTVTSMDMRLDASGKFAGDAVVTFATAAEGLAAAKALQGTEFSGREVRARSKASKAERSTRKGGDAARYFRGDVQATRRPKRFPCFLCAELGHQASSCPRVLCSRCGLMGHQARNCTTPPRAYKPRVHLCAHCGDFDHSTLSCPNRDQKVHLEKLAFLAQCLVCRLPGHFFCGDAPPAPPCEEARPDGVKKRRATSFASKGQLFCANCARTGHQDRDCPSGHGRSSHAAKRMRVDPSRCVQPRYFPLPRTLTLTQPRYFPLPRTLTLTQPRYRPSADYYNSPPGELPLWGSEKTKKSHRLLLQKARRPKPKLGLVREAGCHSTHPRSRGASGLDSERHRRLFVESKELRLVDKPSSLRKRPLLAQARKRGIDAQSTVLRNIKSMSSIFGGARYQEAPRRLSLEVRAKYGV